MAEKQYTKIWLFCTLFHRKRITSLRIMSTSSNLGTDNNNYDGKRFIATMTLKGNEYNDGLLVDDDAPASSTTITLALSLVHPENSFLNPAGWKLDLVSPNESDYKQQFTFGRGEWNTVIDSAYRQGIVWDAANESLDPPDGTPFYLFPFHGRHNQRFVYKNNQIIATQNGYVITYVGGEHPFVLRKPTPALQNRQTFNIQPVDLILEFLRKSNYTFGVLRFSLMWNDICSDKNDLDIHCIQPNGVELMYNNKTNESTGKLDFDITNPGDYQPACENITWTNKNKMPSGEYRLFVHQFAYRNGNSGFRAQIEFDGKIYHYDYREKLENKTNVDVAYVTLQNGSFSIRHCLPFTVSSSK